LDDFWVMDFVRAAPEEVIRQAKSLIRRQRFREMCEEQHAVKALRYMQTEVSDVVDHTNPEETSVFRALLAHLLAPSVTISLAVDASPASSSTSSGVIEGEREREEPPKKRSRPNTPEEVWTNVIDGEDDDGAQRSSSPYAQTPCAPSSSEPELALHYLGASGAAKRSRAVLQMDEDPEETRRRAEGKNLKPVSAERFSQRTEMFESLLVFVGEEMKQPNGSLLDLVDAEDGL